MIHEKLLQIQLALKAPKGQHNNFGNYSYRSCEDILEAVKPILKEHNCTLTLSDTVKQIGERYYIEATASLTSDSETLTVTAFAREPESKKGMDDSQITGSASSYARKYALNGLFCIDDTKDADTDEYTEQQNKKAEKPQHDSKSNKPVDDPKYNISILCKNCGKPISKLKKKDGTELTSQQVSEITGGLCRACAKAAQNG